MILRKLLRVNYLVPFFVESEICDSDSWSCKFHSFIQWLYSPLLVPGLFFRFVFFWTVGRTASTSDQLVARPPPKHRTTQTQNKRIYTPNIHALSGIRTHDPSVDRAKTFHALDRAATVIGWYNIIVIKMVPYFLHSRATCAVVIEVHLLYKEGYFV
jgi:hypothetical protein